MNISQKKKDKLIDALNYLDERLEEQGCCIEEKKEITKCYNLLFDFIESFKII